jgi:hypothetical protein
VYIPYIIELTNDDNVEVEYDEVTDTLPADILPDQVSDISGSGTMTNNVITWPGGTIGPGETIEFSYGINMTFEFAESINNQIQNVAGVTFTDSNDEVVEIEYVNTEFLECDQELPKTNLEGEDLIYVLAIFLMLFGVVAYRRGIGADLLEPLISNASTKVSRGINSKRRFEDNVLEQEKNE